MSAKHYDIRTFSSAQSVGYLLKVAHALMHDAADAAFEGHDVSFMQWLILLKLREGASTSTELCRIMWYDTGALTRLLDQLEDRGLVERQRSVADRRVVNLQLTAEGRRKTAEMVPLLIDRLNAAVGDFSKTDFAQFMRLLEKLIATLRRMEQERTAVS